MEAKRGVEIIWTVICPARPNGNRTIITRSHKRLTMYSHGSRNTWARENSELAIAENLRWALDYWKAEQRDREWWERLQRIRAAQRGENIIWVDFTQKQNPEQEDIA